MRGSKRTASLVAAATATLAFSGLLAAPASAAPVTAPAAASVTAPAAMQVGGYLDCDLYTAQASGSGFEPGRTIVVTHYGDFGTPPTHTLVVNADGRWSTPKIKWSGWTYRVEVRDTQGTLLADQFIHECGIWS